MKDIERELQDKIRAAIKAPLRSEVSTADFVVFGISSTKMSEIVRDVEQAAKEYAKQEADRSFARGMIFGSTFELENVANYAMYCGRKTVKVNDIFKRIDELKDEGKTL